MPRPDLRQRAHNQAKLRAVQQRTRILRAITRRDGPRVEVAGRWLVDCCGSDYLGLAGQFEVAAALQDGAARHGLGAGGLPPGAGRHASHEALEREVAEWLGYPAGLLFANEFLANLAVQQALLTDAHDVCVQDRLNPPALVDAARVAGCKLRRYPHADAEGAIRQLRLAQDGAAMIATEGVFAMQGDHAPLRELTLVARAQNALLYVDDAHGTGVLGRQGAGSVAAARLGVREVPLQLVGLGQAVGGQGAVVVGEAGLVQHLAETAHAYLHAAAMPPAVAMANLVAVRHVRKDEWRRERLAELVARFRRLATLEGLPLLDSDSPIQALACGDEPQCVGMAAHLQASGILAEACLPPDVPEGAARLRLALSVLHTPAQVADLVNALVRARDEHARTRRAG